jgi:tetratricopeptide (TPR) repeat protein
MNAFKKYILDFSILVTFAFFGLASYLPLTSIWGFDHLHFLPDVFKYLYVLVFMIILYLMFGPVPEKTIDTAIDKIDKWLWGDKILPRLIILAFFEIITLTNMTQTHLLGDGYAWLDNFNSETAHIQKWAEPLSVFLIHMFQSLLGGYSYETALTAFRILSQISGLVFIYSLISIIGKLSINSHTRLLGFSTFAFSGAILLFFGYVEFYPLEWAIAALIINFSIGNLHSGKIWFILILYIFSVFVHLQMLVFLPGVAYLIIVNIRPKLIRKIGYVLMILGALGGIGTIAYLYNTKIEFEVLLLPILKGRPVAPSYTFFSLSHLFDLVNLLLLLFPGILCLLVIALFYADRSIRDRIAIFLCFLSVGSLSFTLLFGATITMGRDWDIMSLGFLPPLLLLIYLIGQNRTFKNVRSLISYIIVIVFVTGSFVIVSTGEATSERRFETLLNNRNANVWAVYANYYLRKNDNAKFKEILDRRNSTFPELRTLDEAYEYLERDDLSNAKRLADELVKKDPYNPDFLQIMANTLNKMGDYSEAKKYYSNALKLRPYNFSILNETGQLYIKLKEYDKAIKILQKAHRIVPDTTSIIEALALAYIYKNEYDKALSWADTLTSKDIHSPGAALIKLTIAARQGDWSSARKYYLEFLKYGQGRSDYEKMRDYYKNLK